MKLETRFNLILSICLVLGLGITALITLRVETAQSRDELIFNAEMMLESALAVRSSTPEAAPPNMIQKYGPSNGFGWQFDEVVGAQIIKIPSEIANNKAMGSMVVSMGTTTCIFILIFVVFQVLLRRYVTSPLRQITLSTERSSLGKPKVEEAKATPVGGEFGTLESSIGRLQASVDQAVRLLEKDQ